MATTVTGIFELIDRASGPMERMERQALKTDAAVRTVGDSLDDVGTSKQIGQMRDGSAAMRDMERGAKAVGQEVDTAGRRVRSATRDIENADSRWGRFRSTLTRLGTPLRNTFTGLGRVVKSIGMMPAAIATLLPQVVNFAGVLGSLVGSLGAASVGLAGMIGGGAAGAGVGLVGLMSVIVPTLSSISTLTTSFKSLTTAQQQYGASSQQARDAAKQLETVKTNLSSQGIDAGGALSMLQNLQKFRTDWMKQIKPGQKDFFGLVNDAMSKARDLFPTFSKTANTSMRDARRGVNIFLGALDGPDFKKFMGRMDSLLNRVTGPLAHSAANIGKVFGRVARAEAPYIERLSHDIETTTKGWVDSTRNMSTLRQEIHKLHSQTHSWWELLKSSGSLLKALFGSGAGEGQSLVDDMTKRMNKWTDWLDHHQHKMHTFWKDSIGGAKTFIHNVGQLWPTVKNILDASRPISDAVGQIVTWLNKLKVGNVTALTGVLAVMTANRFRKAFSTGGFGSGGFFGNKGSISGARGPVGAGSPSNPISVVVEGGGPGGRGGPLPVGEPPTVRGGGVGPEDMPRGLRGLPGKILNPDTPFRTAGVLGAGLAFLGGAGKPGVKQTPGNMANAGIREADPTRVLHLVGLPAVSDLLPAVNRVPTNLRGIQRYLLEGAPAAPATPIEHLKASIAAERFTAGRARSPAVAVAGEYGQTPGTRVPLPPGFSQSLSAIYGTTIQNMARSGDATMSQLKKTYSQLFIATQDMGKKGQRQWATNMLMWAQEIAKGNPKLRGFVGDVSGWIENRFGTLGGNVDKSWASIERSLAVHAQQGSQQAGQALQTIEQIAVSQLQKMGYSAQESRNIVMIQQRGPQYAEKHGLTGAGQKLTTSDRNHAQALGYAGGGRVGGRQGRSDNVLVRAGAGELMVNGPQEQKADSFLRPLGTSLASIVNGVGTPHGFAQGGRTPSSASGGWRGVPPTGLQSGIRRVTAALLGQFPGLSVTSTTGGEHVSGSYHYLGEATDTAGSPEDMLKASQWIKSSGLYHNLEEGIHNPNLSVSGGSLVDPSFYSAVWAEHANHIHMAVTAAASKLGRLSGAGAAGARQHLNLPRLVSGLTGIPGAATQQALDMIRGGAQQNINKALARKAGGPAGGDAVNGSVKSWLTRALRITGHYTPSNLNLLYGRTMQESGGNPRAINRTDSNAAAGTPSEGLLQTIGPTFAQYHMRGYNDIWNPIDNAIAAIRYMFSAYGHIVGPSGSGYSRGGRIPGIPNFGGWFGKTGSYHFKDPTLIGVGDRQGGEDVHITPGGSASGSAAGRPVIIQHLVIQNHRSGDIREQMKKEIAQAFKDLDRELQHGSEVPEEDLAG